MLPLAVLLAVVMDAGPVLTPLTMVVGVVAALVQAVGLHDGRSPCRLARRYVAADGPEGEAARRSVRSYSRCCIVTSASGSASTSRYLATGAWTLLVSASILQQDTADLARVAGLAIGVVLLIGTLEFVGPNGPAGWEPAGMIVAIAYVAWSVWLILIGVILLIGWVTARLATTMSTRPEWRNW